MRDSEIEEDLAGGSFLDDPRLKEIYLSKSSKDRREMAMHFRERRALGLDTTAEERKQAYDHYFETRQMADIAEGCAGCLVAVLMAIGILYVWLKG